MFTLDIMNLITEVSLTSPSFTEVIIGTIAIIQGGLVVKYTKDMRDDARKK